MLLKKINQKMSKAYCNASNCHEFLYLCSDLFHGRHSSCSVVFILWNIMNSTTRQLIFVSDSGDNAALHWFSSQDALHFEPCMCWIYPTLVFLMLSWEDVIATDSSLHHCLDWGRFLALYSLLVSFKIPSSESKKLY